MVTMGNVRLQEHWGRKIYLESGKKSIVAGLNFINLNVADLLWNEIFSKELTPNYRRNVSLLIYKRYSRRYICRWLILLTTFCNLILLLLSFYFTSISSSQHWGKQQKNVESAYKLSRCKTNVFLHSRKADQPFKRSRIFSLCRFLAARFILVFLLLVQLLLFSEIFDIKKLYNYRELPSYDVLKSN